MVRISTTVPHICPQLQYTLLYYSIHFYFTGTITPATLAWYFVRADGHISARLADPVGHQQRQPLGHNGGAQCGQEKYGECEQFEQL